MAYAKPRIRRRLRRRPTRRNWRMVRRQMLKYHRIAICEKHSIRFNAKHNKKNYFRGIVRVLKSVIIASRKRFEIMQARGEDAKSFARLSLAVSRSIHVATLAQSRRMDARIAARELNSILRSLEGKEKPKAAKSILKAA